MITRKTIRSEPLYPSFPRSLPPWLPPSLPPSLVESSLPPWVIPPYLSLSGESSRSFFRNLLMVSSMVLPILSLISPSFSLKGKGPLLRSQSSSHFPRPSLDESYLSPAAAQHMEDQVTGLTLQRVMCV